MKNEFILFLIECDKTDCNGYYSESKRIKKMVDVEHFAVKHTASEHLGDRIKRICHKSHFENLALDVKLLNLIENRGEVEKKCAEYLIEIFNILEENFKCGKNKTDADAYQKKNQNGYR